MRNRSFLFASAAMLAAMPIMTLDAKKSDASGGGSPASSAFEFSPKVAGDIVAATDTAGFYTLPVADAQGYSDAGYVDLNPSGPDGEGNISVRATDKLRAEIGDSDAANVAASGKGGYEVEEMAFPSHVKPERRTRETKYPFETLGAPTFADDGKTIIRAHSFHILATAELPNPEKSLTSSVSSAQARYNVPVKDGNGNVIMEAVTRKIRQKNADGTPVKGPDGKIITQTVNEQRAKTEASRVFRLLPTEPGDPKGKGARVWRVA